MKRAVCTIISRNYLPYARVLGESLRTQNPECEFFVLVVDDVDPADQLEPFEVINVSQLQLPNFRRLAFRYNQLELNTNVKPTFLSELLEKRDVEDLLYLDPDILICAPLEPLFSLLERFNILLTPHCASPIPNDGFRPSEVDLLLTGSFNLGFVGLRRSEETRRFLAWWQDRCIALGYAELRSGLFVDQKWVNLVPSFFDSVHMVKDLGCNMAYWNLHERVLAQSSAGYRVNEIHPLRFFHFSGIDIEDEAQLSRHCSRYRLAERQDLIPLFREYRERITSMGYHEFKHKPYAFGSFSEGGPVTQIARTAFAISEQMFADDDPFSTGSRFYHWARSKSVIGKLDTAGQYSQATYKRKGTRVRIANKLLATLLRMVGPNRYTILMKYLSYVSILRNQPGVLSPE